MTSDNSKHKTLNIKQYVFFFLFTAYCLLFIAPSSTHAAIRYPIKELGNCRDGRECSLYCQIPGNTPACWSYGKFIMNPQVLGEVTVNITYPVANLGNCSDATACFQYCTQPEHQSACIAFGKTHGLVKEEKTDTQRNITPPTLAAAKKQLGCESKESCLAVCNLPENAEKCTNFAQKYGLRPSSSKTDIPPQVIAKMKKELNCTSQIACMNLCNIPENMDRCMDFAEKYKLLKEEQIKHYEDYRQEKQSLLVAAKTKLGCTSSESCAAFCKKEENAETCRNFTQEVKLNRITEKSNTQTPTMTPAGCTSQAECKSLCEKNPSKCPGFTANRPQTSPSPKPTGKSRITPKPTSVTLPINEGGFVPSIQPLDTSGY